MWPNALFFIVCVFGFGLTRSSVRLLAADPPGCAAGCRAKQLGDVDCLNECYTREGLMKLATSTIQVGRD